MTHRFVLKLMEGINDTRELIRLDVKQKKELEPGDAEMLHDQGQGLAQLLNLWADRPFLEGLKDNLNPEKAQPWVISDEEE